MNVELRKDEAQNVKVALLLTAKRPEVEEAAMETLLMLAQKFTWKEEEPKVVEKEPDLKK